jgi:hypothetical protein
MLDNIDITHLHTLVRYKLDEIELRLYSTLEDSEEENDLKVRQGSLEKVLGKLSAMKR